MSTEDDDITFALEAKSDQLNATDLAGAEPVIRIREVKVKKNDAQQPVWIYYDGDKGRPWKPNKSMRRILAIAWGVRSSLWVGRYAQIFNEPTVIYAGAEVGGIRIRALSDIPKSGIRTSITISKSKRVPFHVEHLVVETKEYPEERFLKALPVMAEKMASGEMSLQQVVAQCQKTGQLNASQLERLEQAAPHIIDNEDESEEQA